MPPSSKVKGTRFSDAAFITCLAMAVPPVKIKWSKASPLKAAPTSGSPINTPISDSSKYSSIINFVRSDEAGVSSEGFNITLLPADKIPAKGAKARFRGKFQGLIAPTTPLGWYLISAFAPKRDRADPKGAIAAFLFSVFIHFFRFFLAWIIGPITESTSVAADITGSLLPKSSCNAEIISDLYLVTIETTRSSRSDLSSRLGAPSLIFKFFWSSNTLCIFCMVSLLIIPPN